MNAWQPANRLPERYKMNIDELYKDVSSRETEVRSRADELTDLLESVNSVRNQVIFLKAEIDRLLHKLELHDPDYPALLESIKGELVLMLEMCYCLPGSD